MEVHRSEPKEQGQAADEEPGPYRSQDAANPNGRQSPIIRLVSPEQLVWHPKNCSHQRMPVVSLGTFKNGTPCLHFRAYARKAPGEYAITTQGISLDLASEFDQVVARIADLRAVLPGIGGENV